MRKKSSYVVHLVSVFVVLSAFTSSYAVTEYDLAYQGAVEIVNGAIYQQWDEPKPMGTGVIDAFVQIQGSNSVQHGYNTNGIIEFDTQPGSRTLLLSDIPVVEINGDDYREFLLDINQEQQAHILSVDKIQIFLETTDSLSGYPGCFSAAVYDLDEVTDNYIKLDDDFGAGSGKGDMLMFVLDSDFTEADNYNPTGDNYIYLYSMFGENFDGSDGFEEWAIGDGGSIIPEPATLVLLGFGALALLNRRKKV